MVPELLVSDFAHSRRFYIEVLGFTAMFERHEPLFVYLDLHGAQLMLEQDHLSAWITDELQAPRGRGLNLQIEVDDLTAVRTHLLTAGYPLFRDLHESWYDVGDAREGQRELLVQDPDGYLLRLVEPLSPPTT